MPLKVRLLFVIGIVAIVGHVCALPTHTHVSAAAGTHGHADAADSREGEPSEDAVHAASCDAVRTPTSTVPAPVGIVARYIEPHETVRSTAARRAAPVAVMFSPPLFLLHAALLI
ncbi:MAG TPA: hypothetical protein VGU22_11550 [Methylomirabilota bacterium]|nr:hypothetical protein [Methylomirabilota bacterium]